jgi:hypothetical protein
MAEEELIRSLTNIQCAVGFLHAAPCFAGTGFEHRDYLDHQSTAERGNTLKI